MIVGFVAWFATGDWLSAGTSRSSGEVGFAPSYAVVVLPGVTAWSVNNKGEILCGDPTAGHWLLWHAGLILGSGGPGARKVNDLSQVLVNDGESSGIVSGGSLNVLSRFNFPNQVPGSSYGRLLGADDMNGSGQVIGTFYGGTDDVTAGGLWNSPASEPLPLAPLWTESGQRFSGIIENGDLTLNVWPNMINDAGTIVGSHSYLPEPGAPSARSEWKIWYGANNSQVISSTNMFPYDLNEWNQVTGIFYHQGGGGIWEPSGGITIFDPAAVPFALNSPSTVDEVTVVGRKYPATAMRWKKTSDPVTGSSSWLGTDLNTTIRSGSGWTLKSANAINNSGVIVGEGTYADPAIPNRPAEPRAFLLLPLELKVVDRDDPKKKWADAKDWPSKPIYAGASCGDMVSWKLAGTDGWSSTTFTWTAEGPGGETITGPTGAGKNEWKIADGDDDTANDWLKWKPGKWKIKVQFGSTQAEFEQEVGTRTEQYFVVGTIPVEPEDTTGVSADTINDWACPNIIVAMWAAVGGGINSTQSNLFVPMNVLNRVYVNERLLNATRNLDPQTAINADKGLSEACGLDPHKHYRWSGGCQFKFKVNAGKFAETPQVVANNKVDLVGFTPGPCSQSNWIGIIGERHPDSGKITGGSGDTEFSYVLKNRAGRVGQTGWQNLNGRDLPWAFFRFRFKPDDGLIDTRFSDGPSQDPNGPDAKDYSLVPSILVYRRYFELNENKWKLELLQKLDEQRRPFYSIAAPVSGAPYVLP